MNLKTWNYENRKVKELPADVFEEHKHVEQVLLSNNRLRQLPTEIFANLEKLTYLNLSRNCFSRIPVAIAKATSLQRLSFENNRIKRILRTDFECNYNLRLLNLSENDLSFIAVDAFKNLVRLNELDFTYSSVGLLEWPIFKSCVALQTLMLGDANLKIGRDLFKGLSNLVTLYLNNNNLSHSDLSVNVFSDLKNLKILDLSENRIRYLQKGLLDHNSRLTKLDLSDNFIALIDAEFFERTGSLEYVSLQNCSPLLNIDFSLFRNNGYLTMFAISYCLNFPIHEIVCLTYLSYDSVCLKKKEREKNGIPELVLSNFINLETLRINDSFISIEIFHEINSRFKKLHILNLKNCTIEDLCNYLFKDLGQLENLIFDNVPLTSFKHVLFKPRNRLRSLSLSNCSLTNITNNALKNFAFLKTLNLSKNNFKNGLNDRIFINLVSLEKIDLSDSKLDYLPLTIFNTNLHLISVRLHHNDMEIVDMKMFENNAMLTFLSVSEFTYLIGQYSPELKVLFVNIRA